MEGKVLGVIRLGVIRRVRHGSKGVSCGAQELDVKGPNSYGQEGIALRFQLFMNRVHVRPRVGSFAWIYSQRSFALPPGLKDSDRVTVMDWHPDGGIRVQDERGAIHVVHRAQLDCGFEFEVQPGQWRHESHPEVIELVGNRFAELKSKAAILDSPDTADTLEEELAILAKVLLRQVRP